MSNKLFNQQDSQVLEDIILHRRDVRGNRFTQEPVSDEMVERLLNAAIHAPSVGYSQPWRFVVIRDEQTKQAIRRTYEVENAKAGEVFSDKPLYQRLKLEGITESPVNIAVFYEPSEQPVLGQTSMPEVGLYSVVCAVQNMWLMARAENIGVGWVSILDEAQVKATLNAPEGLQLVAYLCVGYVTEFLDKPELEILQWDKRKALANVMMNERF
ncbi:MAG: 5,6-dimethylbenzimidazole synthase [Leucothrix sp.]